MINLPVTFPECFFLYEADDDEVSPLLPTMFGMFTFLRPPPHPLHTHVHPRCSCCIAPSHVSVRPRRAVIFITKLNIVLGLDPDCSSSIAPRYARVAQASYFAWQKKLNNSSGARVDFAARSDCHC